jgi:hypothetical protein
VQTIVVVKEKKDRKRKRRCGHEKKEKETFYNMKLDCDDPWLVAERGGGGLL